LLTPNARLRLGPYCMSVRKSPSRLQERLSDLQSGTALSNGLRLAIQSAVMEPRTFSMTDPFIVIGRERPSTMTLADEYLSRVHCVLYRQGTELWVIDLLSSNGTKH